MKRTLPLFFLLSTTGFAGSASSSRLAEIEAEARSEIQGIRQALAEVQQGGSLDETCFRVGSLHLTLRHELDEFVASGGPLTPSERPAVTGLIEAAKALPSFCGDIETAQSDPSPAPIARGDVAGLEAALGAIEQSLTAATPTSARTSRT